MKLHPAITALLTLGVALLGVGFFYLFTKINSLQESTPMNSFYPTRTETTQVVDQCGDKCQKKIAEEVASAIATVSGETKIIEKVETDMATPALKTPQTAYIPLGAIFTTTSTTWVDVPDSKVYIDLVTDYGEGAKVSWEGSLKVAHANGIAYARLFDETHGIAVDGSELKTENNSEYKAVSSGDLPFWRGLNLYKVQVKSLNSFEVTYSGGKVKVRY